MNNEEAYDLTHLTKPCQSQVNIELRSAPNYTSVTRIFQSKYKGQSLLAIKNITVDFNKPFLTGKEPNYILQAAHSDQLSGNGQFTKKCHEFFKSRYKFKKVLLTSSCTDALEMSAILCNIQPGDEVIVPSYSFVSCANAFVLRGAKIVFADSETLTPNIDASLLESLITTRTKAILLIHYAGVACDMHKIMSLARKNGLMVIEDAAHAIDSYCEDRPLGSIGDLATFSFHETKNVTCGEGGLLVVNNKDLMDRADIIWEKGTNRVAFSKGEVNKYEWVDIGSSFLPSELSAAYLYAQLEVIDRIQKHRVELWESYHESLQDLAERGVVNLPSIPGRSTKNGHIFYLVCLDKNERDSLIRYLADCQVHATFHYLPLHLSPFYGPHHDGRPLPNSVRFSECLVRLPLHFQLTLIEIEYVCRQIKGFFQL